MLPMSTRDSTVSARGIVVPARDFGHDLDGMLAAISPETRLVFVANPNNPTGTYLAATAIERFLGQVPEDVAVVLDEAYNEYLPHELRADSVGWLKAHRNLIITRTFSKAYGLAGLRVGYGLMDPDVAGLLNRVRQPFNVNSLALVAAAAALQDQEFVRRSYDMNRAGMAQLEAGCKKLGLGFIPSFANFLTIRVGDGAAVFQKLLRQGVIVRPVGGGYEMPEHLRVTIGLPQENERFLAALATALKG